MESKVEIARVRGLSAAQASAWHEVLTASLAHDLPGEPHPTPVRTRCLLSVAEPRLLTWLATAPGGQPAGIAALRLFTAPDQDHLASAEIHVHPAWRHSGIGTRLLGTLVTEAAARGRGVLLTTAPVSGPADFFCARHGFSLVRARSHLLLSLAGVHRLWLAELTSVEYPGYQLAGWTGTVPSDLAGAFATAKVMMRDTVGPESWDIGRVRPGAESFAKCGDLLLTVAAVRGEQIAGLTQVVIPDGTVPRAQQQGTVVLPGNRGHGLGTWIKAEMLRRVHDEHPHITEIETCNAETNTAIYAINERLGFRAHRRSHEYELDLPAHGQH